MNFISVDLLLEKLEKERYQSKSYEQWALAHVIDLITKMPTIDLNQVINDTVESVLRELGLHSDNDDFFNMLP